MALSGALVASGALEARSRRGPAGPPGAGTANPSALVATEIAFNRRVREKGQWNAFREYADEAAVLFVPQPVLAQGWLSGRKEPAALLQWSPTEVWMSCDGTLGFTTGGWTRSDGTHGVFTTVWKERAKKREYRWVLDMGEARAKPVEEPEFLRAQVTDCPAPQPWNQAPRDKREDEIKVTAEGPPTQGSSDDGTLKWRYVQSPEGRTVLTMTVLKNGETKQLVFEAGAQSREIQP
ncbi:hypothetical protein HT136_05860 [Novosphingobium profundi]|nr:hypothetical protein [Novosphingobium profundi]